MHLFLAGCDPLMRSYAAYFTPAVPPRFPLLKGDSDGKECPTNFLLVGFPHLFPEKTPYSIWDLFFHFISSRACITLRFSCRRSRLSYMQAVSGKRLDTGT